MFQQRSLVSGQRHDLLHAHLCKVTLNTVLMDSTLHEETGRPHTAYRGHSHKFPSGQTYSIAPQDHSDDPSSYKLPPYMTLVANSNTLHIAAMRHSSQATDRLP